MKKETQEEIDLLQELIDNPDMPQDEKDLYKETIAALKEVDLLQELIDNPDTPQDEKDLYKEMIAALKEEAKEEVVEKVEKPKPTATKKTPAPKVEKPKPAPKAKVEKPKPLPVDADKMKEEIKQRTGKTEDECEQIISEYRKLREKSKKAKAKRIETLDSEGKLIPGTTEKTAAAVIETAADNIKDKIEKQVAKIETEANKGNRTPEQIETRIGRNLDKLSAEMTKQATSFIKGIQSELSKADKTEAKQFLLNVREEIDELLSKFAGGGEVGSVRGDINRYKKALIEKAKKKGLYENFGQDEVRKLEDKYGYTDEVAAFDNWAMNFDLSQLKMYAGGGSVERYNTGIGWKRDRMFLNREESYEKPIDSKRSSYDKKKRFDVGGGIDGGIVQTYNITQGNMSASSVNPSLFAEVGGIEPYTGERFTQDEFNYALNLAKHQLVNDALNGVIPATTTDFFELDNYVDRNYYGGFIEEGYDHSEMFEFENSVQEKIAEWLEEGGLQEVLKNPKLFAFGGSIEDQIANADARISNLRELRSVSNDDMIENIDYQIQSIEKEKQRLMLGEAVPKKRFLGLF